jgi:hypothetical protein
VRLKEKWQIHRYIFITDSTDYIGCFTDTDARMFPFIYSGGSFPTTLTNELCYLGCAKEGFKYAATEVLID